MGKRGPAPTPTSLRLLHGDHPERINRQEPQPAAVPPEPPEDLDPEAREIWDRLAQDHFRKVGVSQWDIDALAVYCTAVVHHRRAVRFVNSSSVLLQATKGNERGERTVVKHPAMQIIRDQAAIILRFAQEFGLTPSARSQLTRPREPERSEADRLLS